jgi:hypothetical protein
MEQFLMAPRTVRNPNPALSKAGPSTASRALGGGTWASVAASPVDGKNSIIKFRPQDGLVRRVTEETVPTGPKDTDTNLRVVWIQGWDPRRPLSEVTDHVNQGPLLSMVYSEQYNSICLIFQYSESAAQLLEDDRYHQETRGTPIMGPDCALVEGMPYPVDDDIRRMAHPINERRRLTFARSQLFTHGMNEAQFKRDIFNLVGEANVELVWLFNTGNGKHIPTKMSRC